MFFGTLSVALYAYITYAWRKHYVNMMDSLTSWCWLFANFVWMAGEVFIRLVSMPPPASLSCGAVLVITHRICLLCSVICVLNSYDNLELDDAQQADDASTRLVSGLFFLIGLQLQCLVIFHLMLRTLKERERTREGCSAGDFELLPVTSSDELLGGHTPVEGHEAELEVAMH